MTAQVLRFGRAKAVAKSHPRSIVAAALSSEEVEAEEQRAYDTSRICNQWIGELRRFSNGLSVARGRYGKSFHGVSRLLGAF